MPHPSGLANQPGCAAACAGPGGGGGDPGVALNAAAGTAPARARGHTFRPDGASPAGRPTARTLTPPRCVLGTLDLTVGRDPSLYLLPMPDHPQREGLDRQRSNDPTRRHDTEDPPGRPGRRRDPPTLQGARSGRPAEPAQGMRRLETGAAGAGGCGPRTYTSCRRSCPETPSSPSSK